jgi:uncharacterized protein YbjT (DUF2867 family)
MRILVVGATGMIGAALVRKLAASGHRVVLGVRETEAFRASRPGADIVAVDYAAPIDAGQWTRALTGIDAVVNAVGIFREEDSQTFDALHVKGPIALFDAAVAAGVRRVVQISALGAERQAATEYLASKARADAYLQTLPVAHTVVRPSLVFAPHGRSTRWFALLAALPVTPLPGGGRARVQPIHLDDLCDAIAILLTGAEAPSTLAAVGPDALSMRDYLLSFKHVLALPGVVVSVPMSWARMAARLLALDRRSLVTPDAMRMLQTDNVADSRPFASVLGRTPRRIHDFIDAPERETMRRRAQLGWLLPTLRYAMAAMWIGTGIVSAFVYPRQDGLALLARVGLGGMAAVLALYGAAALDVVLGIAILWRRLRREAYAAQFGLIVFYTLTITAFLPEYWAHPYGPVLKNIPLLAAIALLHQLDERHGPARR